jgi:pimeloyl-ACP methyl ester carboxylesterase
LGIFLPFHGSPHRVYSATASTIGPSITEREDAMQGTAISQDGTPIAFEVEGSGPPLVLLHGFGGEGRDWHEKGYVNRLTALRRRVITLDARGHGKSGKPHRASDYADYKRAQDVAAVLDVLGLQRADLHGYSMGGWIAINAARCFPRRVRSFSLQQRPWLCSEP